MSEGVFHLEVKAISRSAGRSATAAAAYRAGVEITDERTGQVFDYSRKRGIVDSEIFLPEGAPASYGDRSTLWNAAERAETRKNSTVAREIILALPYDLPQETRQDLVRTICKEIVAAHRIAIDANTHAPHSKKGDESDNKNHHAHLEMSTRVLNSDGFGAKAREWDDLKIGPATVKRWRARWAELVTTAYASAGMDKFIDHRSFKDRGIERTPTQKVGVAGMAMTRDDRESDRVANNININQANEKLDALKAEELEILAQMSTLREQAPEPKMWALHDRILNGPSPATAIIAAPETAKDDDDSRAAKELEYAALMHMKKQADAHGEAVITYGKKYPAFLDSKKTYDEMKAPRFAMALRHLGLNAKWDDYIEKKTDVELRLKQKALEIQALYKKIAELQPAMDAWDKTGYMRHKQLADELGHNKTAAIPEPSQNGHSAPSYTTPASMSMSPPA